MGNMFKKDNKVRKKYNVGIKIKWISLLKKEFILFFLELILIEINQKTWNFFLSEKSI